MYIQAFVAPFEFSSTMFLTIFHILVFFFLYYIFQICAKCSGVILLFEAFDVPYMSSSFSCLVGITPVSQLECVLLHISQCPVAGVSCMVLNHSQYSDAYEERTSLKLTVVQFNQEISLKSVHLNMNTSGAERIQQPRVILIYHFYVLKTCIVAIH